MLLNSTLMLLVRAFSSAMMMLVNKRYFMAYMAGDMALYLSQKVGRGDFHYWLPVDGAFGLFASLLLRVLVKTIADFTGVVQFRGPQELGGMYCTLNMVLALLASFVSVFVYYADARKKEELFAVEERMAWTLVGSLSGAWMVVFGVFLLLMKKGYMRTFFSTTTGKQQVVDRFSADDEAVKASVLKKNKKMWWAIREDVKVWVQTNWWRWKREKPAWFDLALQRKVPKDWITDPDERSMLRRLGTKGRRRSSAELILEMMTGLNTKTPKKVKPVA